MTQQQAEHASATQRLPRQVKVLGWVSYFADVSSEMVYPLLPMFLVGVLRAPATALGAIEGMAEALVAVMKGLAGWHSDRTGRRVGLVRLGYGLPVLGKALLATATVWPMVLAGRLVDRLGKGLRTSPRDALIADAVPKELRGRAFGLHRALDTAGAFTGVLLAAGLLWWLGGFEKPVDESSRAAPDGGWSLRLVFAVAAGLGLCALALTFLVREHESEIIHEHPRTPADGHSPDRSRAGLLGLDAGYWRTLAILSLFSLANSSDAFLLLRAADVGLAPWAVVLAYALFNLSYTVVSYPAGIISDRVGRWRVICAGWVVYACCYAGFAVATPAAVWPLMALYGVYMALTDGVNKALIADHAPPRRRGTALGVFYSVTGLTTLIASLGAGVVWDVAGHAAPFWVGAGLACVAVAALVTLRPRSDQPHTGSSDRPHADDHYA